MNGEQKPEIPKPTERKNEAFDMLTDSGITHAGEVTKDCHVKLTPIEQIGELFETFKKDIEWMKGNKLL
jgi:hypothetical protein